MVLLIFFLIFSLVVYASEHLMRVIWANAVAYDAPALRKRIGNIIRLDGGNHSAKNIATPILLPLDDGG